MPGDREFDEINVKRINIVGDDGRVQMVISNRERFPDPLVGGRTFKRRGFPMPGLVFYNSQGDECGGLAFGGSESDGGYQGS